MIQRTLFPRTQIVSVAEAEGKYLDGYSWLGMDIGWTVATCTETGVGEMEQDKGECPDRILPSLGHC